jgi:hypothetical protein
MGSGAALTPKVSSKKEGWIRLELETDFAAFLFDRTSPRNHQIELRTTLEEKRLIAEAAAREQLDVIRFMTRSVIRKVLPF